MSPDWLQIRAGFPSLANWCFLNTATFGQLSARTEDAIAAHLTRRREHACADFLQWFEDSDLLRAKLARLVNAKAEDIAFTPNANWALAHLLHGLDWREGDEALTAEGEFTNHLYAVEWLASRGVKSVRAPYETLLDHVTDKTRLVMLSTVNYSTGYRAPVEEIARELRRRGILFYVDATQSLGALRFDCAEVRPDVLSVNCYKWMLAPNGAAFMMVTPELRERIAPLAVGWRSHHEWRRVDRLHEGAPEFSATAERYEGGMLCTLALVGLDATVEQIFDIGPQQIEERVLELARMVRTRGTALGGEALPYDNSAIAAIRFAGHDASALARELKRRQVQVSARHSYLRVSTHYYNTEADIDRWAEELGALLR